MADVTVYPKRHAGEGAYTLNATESSFVCATSIACDPDTVGCLVKEASGPYVWLVHRDLTRNWIGSPTPGCLDKAELVADVTVYAKRHAGDGAYTLNPTDSSFVCTTSSACTLVPAATGAQADEFD